MAKRSVSDIARERGVSEAEVKQKLTAAGSTVNGGDELVDDDDVRRAFGAKATVPQQGPGQGGARPARRQRGATTGRRRRVVIDTQAGRKPGQKRDRSQQRQEPRREPEVPTGPVKVPSGITVKELSEALGVSAAKLITLMMGMGEMATLTQSLTDDAVELIGAELGREITIQHAAEEEEEAPVFEDSADDLVARPPVVTIMGHVDHGKTTLLDAIRQSSVAAGEAGGITQHIGAYQVDVDGRKVTFLDTPGHEAFTAMRARGAKVTDVAVLVVAADDGVMPQTLEAMDHARAAGVPIVVAVNKIDRPDSNPQRVRTELAQHGLQPEEWGGETIFVDVSAREKRNLDQLLEMLLLQADVLELRANANAPASGVIVESRLDVGRGPVATMLVQRGTLRVGDAVAAGEAWGKVRALTDYNGRRVKDAGPATPVEILGFDKPPAAGELCRVVENERVARQMAQRREQRLRTEMLARRTKGMSLEDFFSKVSSGDVKELALVIKGDVQGSVEAAVDEIGKIQHEEVTVAVISSGVGGITASDVMLAAASNAIVVGFNVRPNADARQLAEREGVDIRTYRVIYQLTEDIQQALIGMLSPEQVEEVLGEAEVRQTFRVSRIGTIAGCMVTQGVVQRGANVRVVRNGTIVHDGRISTLKRFQDDAREVQQGFECGLTLENFHDIKEGDVLEVYTVKEVARTV